LRNLRDDGIGIGQFRPHPSLATNVEYLRKPPKTDATVAAHGGIECDSDIRCFVRLKTSCLCAHETVLWRRASPHQLQLLDLSVEIIERLVQRLSMAIISRLFNIAYDFCA
jgi:hypothetical protein